MNEFSVGLPRFLQASCNSQNEDLVKRVWKSWPVEIQVNIRTDIGEPVDDDNNPAKRRHNGRDFYNFRYPRDAGVKPDWAERYLTYPLEEYASEIGSTGFGADGSQWVGFDFDTILGHAEGVGISDAEIQEIDIAVERIGYAELRRSTGGRGRHIYVHLSDFKNVVNHTEHAALARAILAKLSHDLGMDLTASVDACGGNMWFWSRRATDENRGFELLKKATTKLSPIDVPNWCDYLPVVTRKRSKIYVEGLNEDFAASQPKVRRDRQHDAIFAEYVKHATLIYLPDHGCYHLHTAELAKVHETLRLRGFFETVSEGSDPGKPNAYAYLRPNGAMLVVRLGNAKETSIWGETKSGQACILFNQSLDLQNICRAVDGVWTGKGFTCPTLESANRAAGYFRISLPPVAERAVSFSIQNGGLLVTCDRIGKEQVNGWAGEGRKLKRHFAIDLPCDDESNDKYRHLTTPTNEDAGWAMERDDGTWGFESKSTLEDALIHDGCKKDGARRVLGAAAKHPWTLVNEPFQPEFLAGRRWNRHGRKLIVPGTKGNHRHFDLIFKQCGRMLDPAVSTDPWCRQYGVTSGSRYLLLWAASLIKRPKQPLPWLFLWSPENNTGKSSLHRALGMLFDGGATDVREALVEKFNGQLAGAVLCYVEEVSLPRSAYGKIKSWIDSPTISIREMRTTSYTLTNTAHFIQTANGRDACPVEQHDDRIVVIPVTPIEEKLIPWTDEMAPSLLSEAPNFLATLFDTPLPRSAGRLFLPVLTTPDKIEMMQGDKKTERETIVQALIEKITQLIKRNNRWHGFVGDLLKAIGKGEWSNSPATLSSYLDDAVGALAAHGIEVEISATQVHGQRPITIQLATAV
ncbi:MAG TPA: DUF5906 domain-containing protein [Pirellulales bacterium]|jgi:hypothetical protein|nr:DUF5906 domain-containing protein [Pirellulales bacterium]